MGIIEAIENDNIDELKAAIQNREDVNGHFGDQGSTPLHIATEKNNLEMVYTLTDAGAEVNAIDIDENTPLHSAVLHKADIKIFVELKLQGAHLEAKNICGETPLTRATQFETPYEIVEFLVNAGANLKAIGGEFNIYTPLHLSVYGNYRDKPNPKIVEMLINMGADVEAFSTNQIDAEGNEITDGDNELPINVALADGASDEIIQIFIDHMPNINLPNGKLNTPLHIAAINGVSYNSIKFLLENSRANVNLLNKEGFTPAHLVAKNNEMTNDEKYKIILLMLEKLEDIHKDSLLELAEKKMGKVYANSLKSGQILETNIDFTPGSSDVSDDEKYTEENDKLATISSEEEKYGQLTQTLNTDDESKKVAKRPSTKENKKTTSKKQKTI